MANERSGAKTAGTASPPHRGDPEIQDVSAWILRVGVVASVAVMLCGLALSFWRAQPTVALMQTQRFSADFAWICAGAAHGNGLALIELGILMLVLTPILRVASSMAIFAAYERDWFYAVVTLLVLGLTLLSLLILR